ncbi:hypothetical protein P7C64_05s1g06980 [Encephalitozoon intestinalis]
MRNIDIFYFGKINHGMYEIGQMDRQVAGVAFQNCRLGNIVSGEDKPVTGEMYFSAVNTVFEILIDNEEYLKTTIRDLASGKRNAAQSQDEAKRLAEIESRIFQTMKEILRFSKSLLFESPRGLSEVIGWNLNDVLESQEDFMELISKEVGRCILGGDNIPGFMALHKTDKYNEIVSLVGTIPIRQSLLNLKITAPVYTQWGIQGPSCSIITYVLLVVFCTRLKVEPYVLRQYSSIYSTI